jgi:hypothetical protein
LGSLHHIPNATLDLFYDENIEEEPKIQAGYEDVRRWLANTHPKLLAMLPRRPTPRNDREFWPLRAADALAWNAHRAFTQAQKNKRHSNELWTMLDSGVVTMKETSNAADVREMLVGQLRR